MPGNAVRLGEMACGVPLPQDLQRNTPGGMAALCEVPTMTQGLPVLACEEWLHWSSRAWSLMGALASPWKDMVYSLTTRAIFPPTRRM